MTPILADPADEVRRVLEQADHEGVVIRAVGGLAIALRAPSVEQLSPRRAYHDLDLAARPNAAALSRLMTALGYEPARRFNTLNGAERLLFHDPAGRRVDVFVDNLRMCHDLPFADRLEIDRWTIPLADLALSKLQIVELTDRDAQDLAALLADHQLSPDDAGGISLARFQEICAADWGWWRTVDGNLAALGARWREQAAEADPREANILREASNRARDLRAALDAMPKSLRWRARAAVGSRLAWYSLPEEVR